MTSQRTSRLPALDALRAGAMLCGIVLHSAAPYMHVPLRGLIMPVQEYASTRLPDALFWVIHAIRLPAFFLVAGLLARETLARRGPKAFIGGRLRRLGLPLLVAYPIVSLLMYPTWLWGWVDRGWASWGHFFTRNYGPELSNNIWGLNHLWFLEYLLLYSVGAWFIARLFQTKKPVVEAKPVQIVSVAAMSMGEQSRPNPVEAKRGPRAWRLIPLCILAIVLGSACYSSDASWFLDFRNAYVPTPLAFAYYAIFFVLGLALRREWFATLAKISPLLLLVAAVCVTPVLSMVYSTIWQTDHGPRQGRLTGSSSDRLTLGILVSAIGTFGSLGLMGVILRVVRKPTRVTSFLIDAAYWAFLTHLVWIGLGVMLLHWIAIPPEAKMAIVAAFAMAMSLGTFVPIRHTKVGRFLGATMPSAKATTESVAVPIAKPVTDPAPGCTP